MIQNLPIMTVRANRFTPEVCVFPEPCCPHTDSQTFQVLLSAPRRTAAIPNPDGTLALFNVSTYCFESHSKTSEIRVLDIKTGLSKLMCNDLNASEPTWLEETNLVLWLKGGEKGTTNLVIGDAENLDNKYGSHFQHRKN
jgi:hypothetical protein